VILEIDIGNTRIKWRLQQQCNVVASGSAIRPLEFDSEHCHKIFCELEAFEVEAVHIASVVPSCHSVLQQWSVSTFQSEPVFACAQIEQAGVANGYKDISQMGVDRWLALLAAWDIVGEACLVVDAGSAVTVDLLLGSGKHHGGYIVPGLRLMNEALSGKTDRVSVETEGYLDVLHAGQDTQECVQMGLPLMIVGLVRKAYVQMCDLGAGVPVLLVTGGDGEYIASLLRADGLCEVRCIPELVLDGLRIAITGEDVNHSSGQKI
jgi:type III pantothenate kinase